MLIYKPTRRGNALFLALLSVALLAALTMAITRQMGTGATQTITAERATIYADMLISQANTVSQVVAQMNDLGVAYDQLNFEKPSAGSFNTGDLTKKIYHPAGGGLNVAASLPSDAFKAGYAGVTDWQYQTGYNVEWTPSTSSDVVYSVWGLADAVCQKINKKITGSTTIPATTATYSTVFQNGGTDGDFSTSQCSSCDGYAMLCVENGGTNAFYAVVGGR